MQEQEHYPADEVAYQARIEERTDRMKESNASNKCKFRISVSKEQMQYILACPDCPQDLKKIIELALFKVDGGFSAPAYEIKQLGISALGANTSVQTKQYEKLQANANQRASEMHYKLACSYLAQGLAIPDHLLVPYSQYRYDHDMMDTEEQAAYEREAFTL